MLKNDRSSGSAADLAKSGDSRRPVNAMTVDVEDYFQVTAFTDIVRRSDWEGLAGRVEANVQTVLDLFEEADVKCTFFTLGWVAERYPGLIRQIAERGHEVASHGYDHKRATRQTPDEFRADVNRSKRILEDASGAPVKGYRAASFSIDATIPWAHEILAEEGYRYSSSIFPIHHDHYGTPDAPRFVYRPSGNNGVSEIPMSTVRLFGQNFPCAGGGYFRLVPYALFRWLLGRINTIEGQPAVFYFHPWEIDPAQPRQAGLDAKTRFRHYVNLHRMERKLRALLTDFAWDRMDRIFLDDSEGPQCRSEQIIC